jgi:hypothetical protein
MLVILVRSPIALYVSFAFNSTISYNRASNINQGSMSVMWCKNTLYKSLREKLGIICGWLCKEASHVCSSGVGNKGNFGRSLLRWIPAKVLRKNKVLVIGERM